MVQKLPVEGEARRRAAPATRSPKLVMRSPGELAGSLDQQGSFEFAGREEEQLSATFAWHWQPSSMDNLTSEFPSTTFNHSAFKKWLKAIFAGMQAMR